MTRLQKDLSVLRRHVYRGVLKNIKSRQKRKPLNTARVFVWKSDVGGTVYRTRNTYVMYNIIYKRDEKFPKRKKNPLKEYYYHLLL